MSDEREKHRIQLHENELGQRNIGHEEFRLAAARMFRKAKMFAAASAVTRLEVDRYLTSEEIADRERVP
jgi:hypothetical protein